MRPLAVIVSLALALQLSPGASRPAESRSAPVTTGGQGSRLTGATVRPVPVFTGSGAPAPSPAASAVPGPRPGGSPAAVSPVSLPPSAPAHLSVRGVMTWMPASYGPLYLAVPSGKGSWWRLCAKTCLIVRSTDAGPSKAMQRHPYHRVADIGVALFERICGVPASRGVCWVTVERVR